jgi:phosphoglycerate kinase
MDVSEHPGILPLDSLDYQGKKVLLRVDINSPIDPVSRRIVNENRINESVPTIRYLLDHGAAVAIIAHQGDTLDYQNLMPLAEHCEKLSEKLGIRIRYLDDVAGPAAQEAVKGLRPGEAVLLGNLRYLTEEVSTFEEAVKLEPPDMLQTYLVRNLAPLIDIYVNDAFAAAHRKSPSMVAFQEIVPSAGGLLLSKEYSSLQRVMRDPKRPAVFVLGGAKISDAFGMMKQVLANGSADRILACGLTGIIMLMAKGVQVGTATERFLSDRSLGVFIEPARELLSSFPDRFLLPVDLAYEREGSRVETAVNELPVPGLIQDIGYYTITAFCEQLRDAGTIFMNGPAGVYESHLFETGTSEILAAIADARGFSLIGGGDTVSAAQKLIDSKKIDYVSTAGGAMIRFLSGKKLPLIVAMEKAAVKWKPGRKP